MSGEGKRCRGNLGHMRHMAHMGSGMGPRLGAKRSYFLSVEGVIAFIAAWKAGSITKLFQRDISAL